MCIIRQLLASRSWAGVAMFLVIAMAAAACGSAEDDEPADSAAADTSDDDQGADDEGSEDERSDEDAATESDDAAEPADDAADCTEPVALQLSVPTDPPKYAQLVPVMAGELGFYEQFCLDVEVIGFRTGSGALTALTSGETEIGLPASNGAVVAIGQGSPITVIGSPASNLPQIILATEGIESCEDLAGNTVGTEGPGGLGHYLFTVYLDSCGLDINEDVTVFAGAPGDFAALISQGVINAAALHADDKGVIEEEFGVSLNVLQRSAEFEPNFHYQSYVVREDWLAEEANRDAVVRMMAAALATEQYMSDPTNREEVIDLGTSLSTRPRGVIEEAYDLYSYPTTCAEGLDPAKFEHTAQLQVDLGEMETVPAYEELVDASVCEDAEALLGE